MMCRFETKILSRVCVKLKHISVKGMFQNEANFCQEYATN